MTLLTASRPVPTLDMLCRRSDARVAELAACYDRIAELESTLTECQSYFEECSDVVDGSYGEPAPNREMRLLIEIDEVLL
jgi:hypothetical protein